MVGLAPKAKVRLPSEKWPLYLCAWVFNRKFVENDIFREMRIVPRNYPGMVNTEMKCFLAFSLSALLPLG
jgi:hypothetical protein